MMDLNYVDDYHLNAYFQWMEDTDAVAEQAYVDYPEVYAIEPDDDNFAYEHGAEWAYSDNSQRLLNHLIGCVL